mgnify:CR=1 FL=1
MEQFANVSIDCEKINGRMLLKKAGMDPDGKTVLYDGRTGDKFENRVTVGIM